MAHALLSVAPPETVIFLIALLLIDSPWTMALASPSALARAIADHCMKAHFKPELFRRKQFVRPCQKPTLQ